jgi:hypothetical protein
MAHQRGKMFESFRVSRNVLPKTRDRAFGFLNDLEAVGLPLDTEVISHPGVTGIDLVNAHEAVAIRKKEPRITAAQAIGRIATVRESNTTEFGVFKTFSLGGVKTFELSPGSETIGAVIEDEEELLASERAKSAKALSKLALSEIHLPPLEDFYVTLGLINHAGGGLDNILEYTERRLPRTIDVGYVAVYDASIPYWRLPAQ